MKFFLSAFLLSLSISCSHSKSVNFSEFIEGSPSLKGKIEYLNSSMVTAGDRVYMVGHQDGSFPPLGWHIKGEMGGIWDHPIKLMDGFEITLSTDDESFILNKATQFTNYPYANKHKF
ncbi:MAG: glycogen debranching protein, partial [Flavobacteriaceae bacterium]|nr:glycogen debranching protein [Flavobacteriaceae bacterium]